MDEDDLPPPTRPAETEPTFAGALGNIFGMVLWIGFFLGLAGVALYFVMRWTGHAPW
jgi:hypothetical protein